MSPRQWLRLARPRQWPKNLVLFGGLLFAGRLSGLPADVASGRWADAVRAPGLAFVAFVSFVLLSSAVYALNDIRDAEEDRRHPLKRQRPVAAGLVRPVEAAALAVIWTAAGLATAAWLGPGFLTLAAGYLGLSALYSFWTKHQVILDVLSLSAGFVLRAAAGAEAVGADISPWLLVCSMLLALFLGLVKRRAELAALESGTRAPRRTLEHYSIGLLDQMTSVVAAATLVAYSLYAFAAHPGETPWMMLTIPFVLYGILRYLYLTHQKGMGAAPEQALLGDRGLQVDLCLWAAASALIVAHTRR